jgi:ParB family chromosome partitioning protein
MKQALGKGIKAFIPEEYGILKEETFAELDIEKLKPHPMQPRMKFDEKGIDELAQSIKQAGVLQPIIVVPSETGYRILIGERRWRAAQKAGLQKVPVIIRNIPKDKQLEATLIENLQREDLNPIEIALSYKRLVEELNLTQEEIADKVGKDRASVANYIRLLKLPGEVQEEIRAGALSMGHAKALLPIEDIKTLLGLVKIITKRGLSVRETERMVAKLKKSPERKKNGNDPNLAAVQENLLKALGAKVSISGNQKRGVIKIYYFSLEELNRINDLLKGGDA